MDQNTLTSFVDAVEAMRRAQRAYFKNRTKSMLIDAVQKEGIVDKQLDALLSPGDQGSLPSERSPDGHTI